MNMLSGSRFLPKEWTLSGKALTTTKTNRKSHKLCSLLKMVEKHDGFAIHLNGSFDGWMDDLRL